MTRYVLLTLLVLKVPLFGQPDQKVQPKLLAITNVTIIDCTGKDARADMTVLITGDRITALGKAKEVVVPKGTQAIDGKGKFLIPGLWDMHVHWYDAEYLPLFTANGVTGIRVMWGMPVSLAWRKESAAGTLQGPHLVLAGPIVDGPKPIWPGSVAAGTEAEGRQAVRKTKEEGYDFVKVYSLLPRDVYFAIADEAKKQRFPFVGHVPVSVTVREASDAGQQSMEHLYGILLACSSNEERLAKELAVARKDFANPDRALLRRVNQQLLDTYDAKKAESLFAKFKANGTWQVPTLTVLRSVANLDDPNHTNDTRVKYMPSGVKESWNPKTDFRFKNVTKEDFAQQKTMFDRNLKLVGAMHRAGVSILAGTDVLNPYCFPGFSLHDELALLVKAGLSPMDALQTATRNPAAFLGREKELGTVEPGKLADLVLLDADPLADIKNTEKIANVIVNGNVVTRKALDKMLADAETAAAKK
jgi:cytosine/adenosine deaminase-related metal-dependent hydrolase